MFILRPVMLNTYNYLQVVIGIAFILATVFTAWTPGKPLFPNSANNNENLAFVSEDLPTPTVGPTPTRRTRPLVGIVAGHWGNDRGTVCTDDFSEQELNLTVATLVQKSLIDKGFEVELIKEFDPKLYGYKADALVSIHTDSCAYINNLATGYKVASTMATKHPEVAAKLTSCLRNRYAAATGLPLHSTSVTRDMTSYHAFDEVDPDTIAAIIEIGFLNLDRAVLTQHTDKVAEGIVNGILCFINNESIVSTTSTSAPATTPAP